MISCWLTRREIAQCVDDDRAPNTRAQIHLAQCSGCEQHYRLQQRLVSRLTREAHQDAMEPSPFLRGKIVAAVRRAADAETELAPPAPRYGWLRGLALSGTAAVLIVIGIIQEQPDPNPPSAELLAKVIQMSSDDVLEEATGQDLEGWSKAINDPLESEIESVKADARSAIGTLAASFIPDSMLFVQSGSDR